MTYHFILNILSFWSYLVYCACVWVLSSWVNFPSDKFLHGIRARRLSHHKPIRPVASSPQPESGSVEIGSVQHQIWPLHCIRNADSVKIGYIDAYPRPKSIVRHFLQTSTQRTDLQFWWRLVLAGVNQTFASHLEGQKTPKLTFVWPKLDIWDEI